MSLGSIEKQIAAKNYNGMHTASAQQIQDGIKESDHRSATGNAKTPAKICNRRRHRFDDTQQSNWMCGRDDDLTKKETNETVLNDSMSEMTRN